MGEVTLNKEDHELYSRLYVSRGDIVYARQCADHILKKGWHYNPWDKRGSIYFQQSVYTTTLIVSYARPFTKSIGWPRFPERLLGYSQAERELHKSLLDLRNKVYAHSDGAGYSIRPFRSESFSTEIVGAPILKLSADEANQFLEMTERALSSIGECMQQLLSRSDASTA
jgi:hypothetical protein